VLGESENMGDVNDIEEAWHHVTYFKYYMLMTWKKHDHVNGIKEACYIDDINHENVINHIDEIMMMLMKACFNQ